MTKFRAAANDTEARPRARWSFQLQIDKYTFNPLPSLPSKDGCVRRREQVRMPVVLFYCVSGTNRPTGAMRLTSELGLAGDRHSRRYCPRIRLACRQAQRQRRPMHIMQFLVTTWGAGSAPGRLPRLNALLSARASSNLPRHSAPHALASVAASPRRFARFPRLLSASSGPPGALLKPPPESFSAIAARWLSMRTSSV